MFDVAWQMNPNETITQSLSIVTRNTAPRLLQTITVYLYKVSDWSVDVTPTRMLPVYRLC